MNDQQYYGAFTLDPSCPDRVPALFSSSVYPIATNQAPTVLKNQRRKLE